MTNYQKQVKWTGIIRRKVSQLSECKLAENMSFFFNRHLHEGFTKRSEILKNQLSRLKSNPLATHYHNLTRGGRGRLKYWTTILTQKEFQCIVCYETIKEGKAAVKTTQKKVVCYACYTEFREGPYSKFSQITRYKNGETNL